MILALLLLGSPGPKTAIDAEIAFSDAARTAGQWTAFRRYAAREAVMFTPRPVNALDWLRVREDPPKAMQWQPAVSYVSCDGRWAVNTGAWQGADGRKGYFTTIWRHDGHGWRWLFDHGDVLLAPRIVPKKALVRKAACKADRATGFNAQASDGFGASDDTTLRWRWHIAPDNDRTLSVELWDGARYTRVIDDVVAATQ